MTTSINHLNGVSGVRRVLVAFQSARQLHIPPAMGGVAMNSASLALTIWIVGRVQSIVATITRKEDRDNGMDRGRKFIETMGS